MSAKKKDYVPTAAEMDGMLWAQGYSRWISSPINPKTVRPHELDYLRGIHNRPLLTALGKWLSDKLSLGVRLRSMWQDKHVYVSPLDGSGSDLPRRELADLAVIVNHISSAGIKRSMWILQAKVAAKPLSRFTGDSSKNEIELFENTDCFFLLDGKGSHRGRAYYAREFSGPKHWAFMTFHKNHRVPQKKGDPFPVMRRWPGSTSPLSPSLDSFCASLLDVCKGILGASVDAPPEDDEWSRLYRSLLVDARVRRTTGYAKTYDNERGSVMQLAASALPIFHGSMGAMAIYGNSPPEFRYPSYSRWPELLSQRTLQHGLSLCDGQWSDGFTPLSADDKMTADEMLIDDAFGDIPPDGPPKEYDADQDGEGPSFQQILFIDVWGNRPG